MSNSVASLISLQDFSATQVYSLFEKAKSFDEKIGHQSTQSIRTAGLLFFEPSTRTRCSFEIAANNLGVRSFLLNGAEGTSLEKGESVEDTILNIAAMEPDILVIRCSDEVDLQSLSQQISMPVINAGWGKRGHPTQALLDCFTLYQEFGQLKDKKVLIVGDVKHSRVATSNFELMTKLGMQVAICGPQEFLPQNSKIPVISNLQEGLQWADAVMALRCQFERHASLQFSKQDYIANYQLNQNSMKNFKGIFMHPGPINHGVEMLLDTRADSRSRVFAQVKSGVLIRMAVVLSLLGIGN